MAYWWVSKNKTYHEERYVDSYGIGESDDDVPVIETIRY
jgi:hypothetical protein